MPRERSPTPLSSCVHAEGAVERLLEPLDDSPYHEDVRGEVGEALEGGGVCGGQGQEAWEGCCGVHGGSERTQ